MDRFSRMGGRSAAHPRSGAGKRTIGRFCRRPGRPPFRSRYPFARCNCSPSGLPPPGPLLYSDPHESSRGWEGRARRAPVFRALFPFPLLLLPVAARAGDWRVSPIRLDLGRDAKSGAVTVANDSDDRLQVQMKAYEWTQDAEGKDRYEETGEILFFPRMMILERKEEKILRAGIRVPAVAKEKTYRLFIEEIPGPRNVGGGERRRRHPVRRADLRQAAEGGGPGGGRCDDDVRRRAPRAGEQHGERHFVASSSGNGEESTLGEKRSD